MHHAIGHHDTWMQPRRVTRQCCIQASCQPYVVETLLKGQYEYDVPMQQRRGELLTIISMVHHDNKYLSDMPSLEG